MKKYRIAYIILIFCSMASGMYGLSKPGITELTGTTSYTSLKDAYGWFIDSDNKHSIETITRENFNTSGRNSFRNADSTIWLKYRIKSNTARTWILFSKWHKADIINFYIIRPDGRIDSAVSGSCIPKEERSAAHIKPAFEFHLDNDESATIYLAVKSRNTIYTDFKISSGFSFFADNLKEERFLSFFFGCLFLVCLYSFFIFLSSRDVNYLFYAAYLLFMLLYQISVEGFGNYYLWPESHWFFPRSYNLFISLCFCMALIFTRSFLNLREYSRFLYRSCTVLVFFYLLVGIVCLISIDTWVIQLGTICIFSGIVYILSGSIYSFIKRYKPAKFFLWSWVFLLLGTFITTGRRLDLFPDNFFTEYSLHIGNLLEVILLSMALGDRVKYVRLQKMEAEEALIDANNRILQNRMKPHFLFNSMNIIFRQISTSPQAALSSLQLLSDNYHYLTEFNDKRLIPLEEEIAFLKNYLQLMNLRWPENLVICYDIDERLLNLPVPPVILQPLAENSFKYGLKEAEDKELQVECRLTEETVHLKIINNTITPLKIVNYNRSLGNIQKRIQRYYRNSELILSQKDNRITAEISFPHPGEIQ